MLPDIKVTDMEEKLVLLESSSPNTTSPFPPVDQRGVPQPVLTTKDLTIILFMLLLWAYSIVLTIRAWNKFLSDGSSEMTDGNTWWR